MEKHEQSLLKNINLHLQPLIIPEIERSSRDIDELGQYATLRAFQIMKVMQKGDSFDKEELFKQLNILPKYKKLYVALLDILLQANFIEVLSDKIIVTAKAEIDNIQEKMVAKRDKILEDYPTAKPYVELLWVCTQNLVAILTGKETAQNIMFPNSSTALVEGIYKNNKISEYFNQVTTKAVVAYIKAKLEANGSNQKIRILEVGAGSGSTTSQVLQGIAPYSDNIQYVYTDISKAFIISAKRKFEGFYNFISYSLLNIEADIRTQGYEFGYFDVIIATNVLHATTNIANTIKNISNLLKNNGWLVLNEATSVENFATLTFGLTDGWWLFEDDEVRLKGSPLIEVKGWERILKGEGFNHVTVLGPDTNKNEHYSQHVFLAENSLNKTASNIVSTKLLKDAFILYCEQKSSVISAAEFINVLRVNIGESENTDNLIGDACLYQKKCQFYFCDISKQTIQQYLKNNDLQKIDVVIVLSLPELQVNLEKLLSDLNAVLKHNFIIFISFQNDKADNNNSRQQEWKILLEECQFKSIHIFGDDNSDERLIMAEAGVTSIKTIHQSRQEDKISFETVRQNEPSKTSGNIVDDLILDLKKVIAEILMISFNDIDADEDFNDLGLDSILTSEVTFKLNAIYQVNISPTLFFNCTTVSKLADEIMHKYGDTINQYYSNHFISPELEKRPDLFISEDMPQAKEQQNDSVKDIAIIGVSGLFPGADNVEEFWDLLLQGKEALSELPLERWKNTVFEKFDMPKEFIAKAGLISRADKFDSEFFKISPIEAKAMDPRQRTLLECSYHVIEDAGYKISDLANAKVGVFIGTENNEYEQYLNRDHPLFVVAGSNAMVANRISYHYNFTGLSQTVDASCASGLLAFHNAVKALQRGEIEYAIVGCSAIMYSPTETVEGLKAQLLSPDGHCRTFDQNANGWVIGETVVCTLLKPLVKAKQDNDNIYAIVKGTAVNHGGKVSSVTAPNPKKQAENAIVALQEAVVDKHTISYIAVHGVGSSLIDTAEVEALKDAYTVSSKLKICALGSVTPNIGNVNAASGLASLIQTVMAIKYKKIPPNININQENKSFDLENSSFYLPKELQEWEPVNHEQTRVPRRAAVNSFGITGVNVHLILEEYVRDLKPVARASIKPYIIPLSAKNKDSLREHIYNLINYFEKYPDLSLSDISYTLQVGREVFAERVVIITQTLDALKQQLRIFYHNFSSGHNIFYVQASDKNPEELKKLKKEYTAEQFIILNNNNEQEELATIWAKGVDVPWVILSSSKELNKISLPGYPFKQEHYPVIPESFNAKVDISKTNNIAKENKIQKELMAKLSVIIAQSLQIKAEKIDINTHFREYGVDSMTGMIVMRAIQNEILPSFSITALLEFPTIKSLAEHLLKKYPNDIRTTKSADSFPPCIVPIQPSGTKRKSFWVHELFGDISWLMQFAKSIGEDYPIYGLEIGEIDDKNDHYFSIEAIAARYIESIRKVQPEGPYIIGGYSGGGVIAYEIAYQLVEQGIAVEKLIVLDTFMPGSHYYTEVQDALFNSMDHNALFLTALANKYENKSKSTEGISYHVLLPMKQEKRIEYVVRHLVENTISMRSFDAHLKEINKNIKTSQLLTKSCNEYKAKKFPKGLDLILIRCKSFINKDSKSGLSVIISDYDHGRNWQTYVPNSINIYDIDCDHFELVHSPYIEEVAEICSNILSNGGPMILTEQTCLDLNEDRPYDVGIIGGHGSVGIEVITYLYNNVSTKLLVGGRDVSKAKETLKELEFGNVHVQKVDIFNSEEVRDFCCKCRIVINCAGPSHQIEDKIARIAAETATNFLDVGIMEVLMDKANDFAETLKKNKSACIYGTGLHPGLDDIFAFYADRKAAAHMDEFDSFEVYFGNKAPWYSEGSLKDIIWGIHQGYMNAYLGYYENGAWKKPGIFNMFRKKSFSGMGKQRFTFMFQPLLKPLASRYKKVICYAWFDFSIVLSALKIKFFMKQSEAKAIKYLADSLQERTEKFSEATATTYLYAIIKGRKNNQPLTLKLSMVIADNGYWSVGIIPAIAAQMMLTKQLKFIGAKSLAEVVDPEVFMKILEKNAGIKCKLEKSSL